MRVRVVFVAMLAASLPAASSAQELEIVDTGPLGAPFGFAPKLNESGEVVGLRGGEVTVWDDGRAEGLGVAGDRSVGLALNSRGWVLGSSTSEDPPSLFLGGGRPLLTFPGTAASGHVGLTDHGTFVVSTPQVRSADESGVRVVATAPGNLSDINDDDTAVGVNRVTAGPGGRRTFLFSANGRVRYVGDRYTFGSLVNDAGDVAGIVDGDDRFPAGVAAEGFLLRRGVVSRLQAPTPGYAVAVHDLDDRGRVAGEQFAYPGGRRRAVLWQNGSAADLNDLLPEGSPWYLESATGVNNRGQIVGNGTFDGTPTSFLLKLGVGRAPAVPGAVTAAYSEGGRTAVVTWTSSPGARSYAVYRSERRGARGDRIGTTSGNTSLEDGTIETGQTYYYVVQAINPFGKSPLPPEEVPGRSVGVLAPAARSGAGDEEGGGVGEGDESEPSDDLADLDRLFGRELLAER